MTVLRRCVLLAVLLLAAGDRRPDAEAAAQPGPVPGVTGRFGADPLITIPNGTPPPR